MAKAPKPAHMPLTGGHKRTGPPAARRKRKALTTRVENMTEERWKKVLAATANGEDRRAAAHAARISLMTVDAYLISNVLAAKQLREAQLVHLRRDWPMEKLEQVLMEMARGPTLPAAAKKCGVDDKGLGGLYRLMLKDPVIRKIYDEARELQAESFLDEIIDISDDNENDRLANGKGNHELVNRSRLRVDTRKFAMGSMAKLRFSEHKMVEHSGSLNINHAAVLSGGRKRLEKLAQKRRPAVVDNVTQAVVNE